VDVFKYLKASRELLEAKKQSDASIEAERLGYTHSSGLVWQDPRTGNKYKFEGGRFVDYDLPDRMAAGYDKNEPNIPERGRDYPEVRKDQKKAQEKQQEVPSVADQNSRYIPGGPDAATLASGDVKTVAKKNSRNRGSVMSANRKNQVDQQSVQQIGQYNSEMDALAAAEAEQEVAAQAELEREMGTPEGPLKDPSEFRTLNTALEDAGQNVDGSLRQGDVDIATEESVNRVKDIANTDVEDQRFDSGRQSQKEFLDHYSKDSDNRKGLNILNSLATGNKREKVDQMMEAIDNGDFLREIDVTQKDKRSVSQILLDAGIDVNDQEQLNCFKNAYNEINGFIDGRGKFKTSESSELTGSNLGHYEARHIEQRKDLITMDESGVQTKAFTTRNDTDSNMQCVTPVITDAVYNLLPKPARDELAKSGSPKKFYDPREKNRQGTANPIRGSAALHMWVMQDGRDAYAAAGRRRSPGEFQVEHITPLKSGGKDEIENFSMLLRRVNEPRADLSFEKFLTQAATKASDLMADLSNPKTRQMMERKYRSSRYNDNLAPVVGGAISSLIGDNLMKQVNKSLDENLSKKAAVNLKVKPEDFKNYQKEVKGFLDKNGLDEDTLVSDMTGNQMNEIFDIMTENLGVDKSKMMEYMGRNIYNNYDVGGRTVINDDGELERGRGGTQSSSGNLTTMQNSFIADDSFDSKQKKEIQQKINENHQQFKSARNNYIDNPNDPQAFENYVGSVLNNIGYLTGDGDSPLSPDRKYDTRLTPSEKNSLDDDTYKGIMGILSVDSASIAKDKDVFSPGRQKNLTPKTKEYVGALRTKMVEAASRSTGFSLEQIENPDGLTKTQRKKIEPLLNALENIDRGLAL
jgi:hypothetical protein